MHRFLIALPAVVALSGAASADGLHAVRPLVGYVCMQLTLSPQQIMDNQEVLVRDTPSPAGRVIGAAASVVVAPSPQQPTNGYLQMVFRTGKTGWVPATALKPWQSMYKPDQGCVPSIMSDGLIGFGPKS